MNDLPKNLFKLAMLALLAVVPRSTIAQGTGLVFNDEAYTKIKKDTRFSGTRSSSLLPAVSLKAFCPIPGDQGSSGACTGWATGYGALTICRAIMEGNTDRRDITVNAYSAFYIYNQIKLSDCNGGAHLDAAMKLLMTEGDCLQGTFGDSLGCAKKPSLKDSILALRHRISSYTSLFDLNTPPSIKRDAIQGALANRNPVIVGMKLPDGFNRLAKGTTLWEAQPGEKMVGAHALVIVGYDRTRKAFELMNSWGTDWGNEGFMWISEEALVEYVEYGLIMELADSAWNPNRQNIEAIFSFRSVINVNDEFIYNTVPWELDEHKGGYWLSGQNLRVGDMVQLCLEQGLQGKFAYLIGRNKEGGLELFWPEKTEYNTSAIISEDAYTFPDPRSVLRLTSRKDELLLLVSNMPIPHIQFLLTNLPENPISLSDRLKEVLSERWLDQSSITYSTTTIGFSVKQLPPGKIIPLLIRIREK